MSGKALAAGWNYFVEVYRSVPTTCGEMSESARGCNVYSFQTVRFMVRANVFSGKVDLSYSSPHYDCSGNVEMGFPSGSHIFLGPACMLVDRGSTKGKL